MTYLPRPDAQARKDFIKLLGSGGYSRSMYDKFSDVMEMAYCAFAKPMAFSTERADALEARYMGIVERYRKNDRDLEMIRTVYPELIGIAWNTVKEGGVDFLGAVSSELEILNTHAGQFFTPWSVSQMMAKIILATGDGIPELVEGQGFVTIAEPASGAGGMVLAAADEMQALGYNPGLHMLVHAVDVSPMCFHMTYLQLTWRGIPALVERANTLSLERFDSAWTLPIVEFFGVHGRLFNRWMPDEESTPEQQVQDAIEYRPALEQLRMF